VKVTLIHATPNAVELMIFTKNTRLQMQPEGLDEITKWPEEKNMTKPKYTSNTIPSSWEFADLIFCIEGVTRAFTHQLVRTRTASFAQQTMRVTKMDGFTYSTGPSIGDDAETIYDDTMKIIDNRYNILLDMGVRPEDARGILPTNIHTNIVAKFNLRTFSEMVKKRISGRVQGEYSEVLNKMMIQVLFRWPWARMFIVPKGFEAHQELTMYLRKQVGKEMTEKNIPANETEAWNAMKYLDIARQEG
jgi:thymidylate synthase ThyX